MRAGLGVLSEPFPILTAFAGQNMASGIVFAVAVPLLEGDVVSGIATYVITGASQQTLWRLGIYSKAGALLAQTDDVKALYVMSTKPVLTLTAPFTVPATDVYYFASVWTGSGVGALLRVANQQGEQIALPGGVQPFGVMLGQTDLPGTLVFAPTTTSAYGFWLAAVGTAAP
jgi:hypothetical protein